ncbi:MAG: DNA-deoxyinosine glycosylase [Clostridiales bacterium]|nr:DNA-deoxyinosine glycosylase [Clostridiales bacterium]
MPYEHLTHTFEPFYDESSRILILGSFPSPKSREVNFYYGHPQNRFWKLLAHLLNEPVPGSIEDKKSLLTRHHIALWDVIESCDITGASDCSIRHAVPNDIGRILQAARIQTILVNGATAWNLYHRYCEKQTGRTAIRCPSTSPANAAFSLERLIAEWGAYLTPLLTDTCHTKKDGLS